MGPVNLNELMGTILEIKTYDLRVSSIEIELGLATDLPEALGDATQLQSVLLNLINNAQDAMVGNGGQILKLTTERRDDMVRVSVVDDGPGDLPPIFVPLFMLVLQGQGPCRQPERPAVPAVCSPASYVA